MWCFIVTTSVRRDSLNLLLLLLFCQYALICQKKSSNNLFSLKCNDKKNTLGVKRKTSQLFTQKYVFHKCVSLQRSSRLHHTQKKVCRFVHCIFLMLKKKLSGFALKTCGQLTLTVKTKIRRPWNPRRLFTFSQWERQMWHHQVLWPNEIRRWAGICLLWRLTSCLDARNQSTKKRQTPSCRDREEGESKPSRKAGIRNTQNRWRF